MTPTITAFDLLTRPWLWAWGAHTPHPLGAGGGRAGLMMSASVSFAGRLKEPRNRGAKPGQDPDAEKEGDLVLFESGAIVLHIAETHPGLLPQDASGRARAIAWMFAALSTIGPPVLEFGTAFMFERDQPWAAARLPLVKERVRLRLHHLAAHLGDADWLDGTFSAGDLMVVHAILRLKPSGFLSMNFPSLPPMPPAPRPVRPTSGRSTPNWPSTLGEQ